MSLLCSTHQKAISRSTAPEHGASKEAAALTLLLPVAVSQSPPGFPKHNIHMSEKEAVPLRAPISTWDPCSPHQHPDSFCSLPMQTQTQQNHSKSAFGFLMTLWKTHMHHQLNLHAHKAEHGSTHMRGENYALLCQPEQNRPSV